MAKLKLFTHTVVANKNTLGTKKWCGQEKQQLKGVICECGQD